MAQAGGGADRHFQDNRNRTVREIRHILRKNGGNMGEAGSVAWMFHKKGPSWFPRRASRKTT